MRISPLTAPEQRVLGCLIEKRLTTPDQYPLSLNSLRLACNQSTNRNPVTQYDEATVRDAAQRLCKHGLARLASGHTSRAIKYRHLAEEALGLSREELSTLAVLLLRGEQTPGELKSRSERMAHLESLADVERVLDALARRGYVRRLPRRPGQKEDRFEHLLGDQDEGGARVEPAAAYAASGVPVEAGAGSLETAAVAEPRPAAVPSAVNGADLAGRGPQIATGAQHAGLESPAADTAGPGGGGLAARVAALEVEIAVLRAEIAALRRD